ncbi:MAG: hypothetical protein FWF82_03610 [Oscillospiraceae bacterium]|nr:hypothetical protein [Oscillospiraceae bacterium]
MSDLSEPYQQEDWEKENKAYFYPYTGSYEAILSADKLVEWQWPGSDRERIIIDFEEIVNTYKDDFRKPSDFILCAYTDGDGREWVKLYWNFGWVCVSDPENREIPMFNPAPPSQMWSVDNVYDHSTEPTVYPPVKDSKLPKGVFEMPPDESHLSYNPPDEPSYFGFLMFLAVFGIVAFFGYLRNVLSRKKIGDSLESKTSDNVEEDG